jgi:hypothetical protein
VLIFWLLGVYPWVLLLTWAVSFYLTFVEARQQRFDAMRTLWWMLLVFFTHFLGYLALRGWVFYKRRKPDLRACRSACAGSPGRAWRSWWR